MTIRRRMQLVRCASQTQPRRICLKRVQSRFLYGSKSIHWLDDGYSVFPFGEILVYITIDIAFIELFLKNPNLIDIVLSFHSSVKQKLKRLLKKLNFS